jgi:hypothetical protein
MTVKRYHQFINPELLQILHKELISSAGWVFRKKFWRYYLISGLVPYDEFDTTTWYHNQPGALERLQHPWDKVFAKVFDLAGPNFKLMRYALTGQTQNQIAEMHKDVSTTLLPGHWRSYLIYLNTEYQPHWGGSTEIQLPDGTLLQELPEPGKLIEFDSQLLHVGRPPEITDFLRLTMVLHGFVAV